MPLTIAEHIVHNYVKLMPRSLRDVEDTVMYYSVDTVRDTVLSLIEKGYIQYNEDLMLEQVKGRKA